MTSNTHQECKGPQGELKRISRVIEEDRVNHRRGGKINPLRTSEEEGAEMMPPRTDGNGMAEKRH